ncbi:MAG: acetyl-CoA hydrolase/transferase C-terminal domain-containing protein [Evtepia gabavorous]
MSIDLLGQVAAEGMGTRQSAKAPAVQVIMSRWPSWPRGANPFWPSPPRWAWAPDGAPKSRIVPTFPPATIVTTPRSDVQYVVTEYGVVNLKPLTTRDRARALIDLAHPDCRGMLTAEAKKLGLL